MYILIALLISIVSGSCVAVVKPLDDSMQAFSVALKKDHSWTDIFQQSKNAVVQIINYGSKYNPFEPYKTPEQQVSAGTGFIINQEGYILTNYHVVDEAMVLIVQLPQFGREQFEAVYVGGSYEYDIALIKIVDRDLETIKKQSPNNVLEVLTLGESDALVEAQPIMIIGYPLGMQSIKATLGEVSGRQFVESVELIQTSAAVNPGNSGGPIFDQKGKVIGLCVAKIVAKGVEGVNFVIPINRAINLIPHMREHKVVQPCFWGFVLAPTTPEILAYEKCKLDQGVRICEILKGSLAEKMGIAVGDIILSVNGYQIDKYGYIKAPWRNNEKVLLSVLAERIQLGEQATVVVSRQGKQLSLSTKVVNTHKFGVQRYYPWHTDMPDYEILAGLILMDLTLNHLEKMADVIADVELLTDLFKFQKTENRIQGKVVVNLIPGTPVSRAHVLSPGDIITEINGVKVNSVLDVRKALAQTSGQFVTLKTEKGALMALSVRQIVSEEPSLAKRYSYELSPSYYKLAQL